MTRPGPELRDWISRHLDPLDDQALGDREIRSDFDLNPDMPGTGGVLTPAAVLVGLVEREAGLSVILTRRSETLRRHTGQVAFPGGRCDPGETPSQTALREANEEIGLDPAAVSLAGMSTPYRTGTGYLIAPVVGFVRPDIVLTPSPDEVAHIFETPFGFLMDPANHEKRFYDMPDGGRRHFYAMSWEDQLIWGATAGMLRALYDRLYGAAMG
ncbi:8-oxo-dGTP pyrophosphatase MutT (NUDIX family) [Caulobacter ginsengisoli]|uniref:8-oxo-dGTP pyrophosphatase MutT (NUDIX family) n=1 Tax=Caulobacter ginsengisoli TaxID=400775 RepID=A0ABU0IVI6_9CAUL|nr:CoA pyrophosphatase [Caulobacter ginsengisoli]MDQ0466026.1 8-oxo-dGTP pyrophosphatase MutT (NUDIX family) [Caulobacter ginsengisoli]